MYGSATDRVLVEPARDGTQSCLYHIVDAFVGQNMTQVRRGLGAWYLQPVNQARLCEVLPTNFRTQPNGVGDHAQRLTPPTWRMNVMSIA